MSSAIRTEDLSKRYRRTVVLDGLNLDVPAGSIYGLVGVNGAGKTTTIKLLMNLVEPSGGRSEVLETDSRRLRPHHFTQIGYVSENQEMPDWMTVGYYLQFLSQFYLTWDRALEAELVSQMQLPLDRKLKHLSRGMRMKAALASSLAYRPKLIVLDEPFSGLDSLVRDELIEGLLARAEGTTILISSHDLAEIESFASHIGYLDNHRLEFSEELESLSARFREVVLTFDAPPALPRVWPDAWLQPESAGAVVRFVDSRFDEAGTPAEVRALFPQVRDMAVNGMPLRSIFVALAKAGPRRESGNVMKQALVIFRKDVKHLWPYAAVMVALLVFHGWIDLQMHRSYLGVMNAPLATMEPLLILIAWPCIVGLVMQQEYLPGNRQYWLTRPISRPALIAAKALFLVTFISLPNLLAQTIVLGVTGFSPIAWLGFLLWNQVLLGVYFLSAAAIAAVTANFRQYILTSVAIFAVAAVELSSNHGNQWGGVQWVGDAAIKLVLMAGGVVILTLQYSRRRVVS